MVHSWFEEFGGVGGCGGVSDNFDVTPVESTELVNLRIACSTHSVAGLGPLE